MHARAYGSHCTDRRCLFSAVGWPTLRRAAAVSAACSGLMGEPVSVQRTPQLLEHGPCAWGRQSHNCDTGAFSFPLTSGSIRNGHVAA